MFALGGQAPRESDFFLDTSRINFKPLKAMWETLRSLPVCRTCAVGLVLWLSAGVVLFGAEDFRQTSLPWQQVEADFGVVLGLEREVFEPMDGGGRFVVALQCGKSGGKPEDYEVAWSIRSAKGASVAEGTGSLAAGMLGVDFPIRALEAGDYEVTASVRRRGKEVALERQPFSARPDSAPAGVKSGRVPLIFPDGVPRTTGGFPLHLGVPFPRGVLTDSSKVRVVDGRGREIPAQFQTLGYWGAHPASGIRWLGVDIQAPQLPSWWPDRRETPYFLEYGKREAKATPRAPLKVEQDAEGIHVQTGPLEFLVRAGGFNLLDNVRLNGVPVLDQKGGGGAYLLDQEGTLYRAANDRNAVLTIEESGPLRVVIRAEGWYVKDGTAGTARSFRLPTEALCRFVTRIEAHAGLPWVRVLHTWINTSDSYSVFFRDLGFSLLRSGNAVAVFGVDGGDPNEVPVEPGGVHLVQHLPDAFEISREDGQVLARGVRSNGLAQAVTENGEVLSLGLRETWERFPKEFEVLPGEMRLHVWPVHGKDHPEIDPYAKDRYHQLWFAHQGRMLDLRFPWETLFTVLQLTDNPSRGIYKPGGTAMGGVQSSAMGIAITSDFLLGFGHASTLEAEREDIRTFLRRPVASVAPEWISQSGALGPLHPYDPENFPQFEAAAEGAMFGLWDLQEETGEFGMFLYRGWHHGQRRGEGFWWPYRLYSAGHHYDPFLPWLYFARSGHPKYARIGMAGMRHLTDLGVTHHADPDYEFREFYSEQPKLVGSTGHTNGFVLWGGDHAILSHQTSYGAMMLAWYLTGDPRFRDTVMEWKTTLLEDRLNPGWAKAARMNWGKNVPEVNRDNNQALGEMLDLYQLTGDARLLALMQPCMKSMEQNMYSWSRELQSALAFRRTPKFRNQLIEAVKARQDDPSSNRHHVFPDASFDYGRFALAAWADPGAGFEKSALWRALRANLSAFGKDAWTMDRTTPNAFAVSDHFLHLPLLMKVAKPLLQPGWKQKILPGQKLPIASELGGTKPTLVVVRKETDRDFDLNFQGKITSSTAHVIVTAPDGRIIKNVPIPPGDHFTLTLPKDGLTGDYVIAAMLQAEKDSVRLPISNLEHEVYVTSYWIQPNPQCFFIGAPNGANASVEISAGKNAFTIERRDDFALLGERATVDFETEFHCPLPPEGAWLITSSGRYFSTPKTAPLVLALHPDKFFLPAHLP